MKTTTPVHVSFKALIGRGVHVHTGSEQKLRGPCAPLAHDDLYPDATCIVLVTSWRSVRRCPLNRKLDLTPPKARHEFIGLGTPQQDALPVTAWM